MTKLIYDDCRGSGRIVKASSRWHKTVQNRPKMARFAVSLQKIFKREYFNKLYYTAVISVLL